MPQERQMINDRTECGRWYILAFHHVFCQPHYVFPRQLFYHVTSHISHNPYMHFSISQYLTLCPWFPWPWFLPWVGLPHIVWACLCQKPCHIIFTHILQCLLIGQPVSSPISHVQSYIYFHLNGQIFIWEMQCDGLTVGDRPSFTSHC